MPVVERMPFVGCLGRNRRFEPLLVPWNLLAVAGRSPWLRWEHRNIPELRQIRTLAHRFAAGADIHRSHFAGEDSPVESDIHRVVAGSLLAVAAGDNLPGQDNWAVPEWQLCPGTAGDYHACRSSSAPAGLERPCLMEPSHSCTDWGCMPAEGRRTSHHPEEYKVAVGPFRHFAGR